MWKLRKAWDGLGWLGDSVFHDNHEISKHVFFRVMAGHHEQSHKKCSWQNLQKIWSVNHAMPWLSSAQRTPGLIDEAHFVHIFGHSCNILGTGKAPGWITFHDKAKVFSGCGFLKRPYVIVSPRITLIQRLLKYSPLPDISPLPDHGVVLDHWIYSFWGLLFGALQIRLIRGKGSPLFQSSDSHVAMAVFFGLKHLIARRQTSNGG